MLIKKENKKYIAVGTKKGIKLIEKKFDYIEELKDIYTRLDKIDLQLFNDNNKFKNKRVNNFRIFAQGRLQNIIFEIENLIEGFKTEIK